MISGKRGREILIVIAIIAVFDILLAQILKHTTDFWNATYPSNEHRVRSDIFHHGLVANGVNQERWGEFNYSVATNSLGFKDETARKIKLDSDAPRLLVIGDSFTEGSGFSFPQTFVGLAAKELNGKGVEVLNAGVASYTPEIYYRKIRHLIEEVGLKFTHVTVFLDISDIRDEVMIYKKDQAGNLVVPVKPPEKLSRVIGHALRDNSMLARLFTQVRDAIGFMKKKMKRRYATAERLGKSYDDVSEAEMTAYAVVPHFASEWTYNDSAWKSYGELGRKSAAANMAKLHRLLQGRGIKLTLAVYPWPDQIINDPKAPRHRGFWAKWAAERQVGFVDLFPLFTHDDPSKILKEYFIQGDMHWNAKGHALVAEEFLKQLNF